MCDAPSEVAEVLQTADVLFPHAEVGGESALPSSRLEQSESRDILQKI